MGGGRLAGARRGGPAGHRCPASSAACRSASGVAWICVISAEMISGQFGVGYRTWQDYTVVDYPGVFVGMVTIGVARLAHLQAASRSLGRRAHPLAPPSEAAGTSP